MNHLEVYIHIMKGYNDSPAFVSVKVAETQIPKLSYHNNIIKYMASY